MTTLRAQVTLPNVNGLPADAFVNTFHFLSGSVDPVDSAEHAATSLQSFYASIDGLLASTVDTVGTIEFYDLEDPTPRTPIYIEPTLAITPGANAPLPAEVACVMSYSAQAISGVPAGRRRGRIFLGPLDSAVMDDTVGQSLLQTASCELIAAAGQNLINDGDIALSRWAVFSPTSAGPPPWTVGEILGATLPVLTGHVDNAFDTMRSRGVAATSRFVFQT